VAFGPRPLAAQVFLVSGDPAPMIINSAAAGGTPFTVTSTLTTYSITSLFRNARIRATLSAPLPTGVTLRINVQAPAGGISSGWVTLTGGNQQVVGNIPVGAFTNLQIRYELSATVGAGVVALNTRMVTLSVSPF
jgi:hypothetical protein